MRKVLVVVALTLMASACGKKPNPVPPTEPTKVSEADVAKPAPTPAEPVPDTTPKVQADVAPAPAPETTKPAGEEPDAKPSEPAPTPTPAPAENPPVTEWMAWEGGVDVVGMTKEGLQGPNVVFHLGRVVHTPVGSAASGMILWQPEADKPPVVAGFVSTDAAVGAYFGPKIFVGTPFEKAPVTVAEIGIKYDAAEKHASAKAKVGDHTFEADFTEIGDSYLINRSPAAMTPFNQQGVEAKVGKVVFKVDGAEVKLILPPVGLAGGPAAVFSAAGIYAR